MIIYSKCKVCQDLKYTIRLKDKPDLNIDVSFTVEKTAEHDLTMHHNFSRRVAGKERVDIARIVKADFNGSYIVK